MLYRYCSWIFIVPQNSTWEIYHLGQDGITPGAKLRIDGHTKVSPGNYIVLDAIRGNVQVALTDMRAPRRVVTRTKSTGSERDSLVMSNHTKKKGGNKQLKLGHSNKIFANH